MGDNAKGKEPKPWLDHYPVISEDDHPDLDARAAVAEFKDKMPRELAERKAHEDYVQEHAYRAAAHHLLGTRAAVASGHDAAAKRHGEAYAAALEAAGHSPMGTPPQKVLDYIQDLKHQVYSFKGHPADVLFEPKESPKATDDDKALKEKLEKLRELKGKLGQ
jgi:hypothetical protein